MTETADAATLLLAAYLPRNMARTSIIEARFPDFSVVRETITTNVYLQSMELREGGTYELREDGVTIEAREL